MPPEGLATASLYTTTIPILRAESTTPLSNRGRPEDHSLSLFMDMIADTSLSALPFLACSSSSIPTITGNCHRTGFPDRIWIAKSIKVWGSLVLSGVTRWFGPGTPLESSNFELCHTSLGSSPRLRAMYVLCFALRALDRLSNADNFCLRVPSSAAPVTI